ncbi:MAG: hypothetical protein P4L92_05530 [Rudaea sp.]|nr:hypothetical protein [Rudaea sp.]
MSILRFRVTGSRDAVDGIVARLNGIDELERVEEVDDEMPDMRDDSSSSQLPDDIGPPMRRILVETPHASANERVHDMLEIAARDLDVAVEFVDRF